MSVQIHPWFALIWLTSILVRLILSLLCFKSKSWSRHPEFCLYVLCSTLLSSALFICSCARFAIAYSYLWAVGSVVQQVLTIFVAISCFRALFVVRSMPSGFIERFFAPVLLIAVGSVAIYGAHSPAQDNWLGVELSAIRSASLFMAGTFWVLSFVSDRYGIPWRTQQYAIGLGFLFQLSVSVAIDGLAASSHPLNMWVSSSLGLCTTLVTSSVWVAFFRKQERPLVSLTLHEVTKLDSDVLNLKKRVQSIRVDTRKIAAR